MPPFLRALISYGQLFHIKNFNREKVDLFYVCICNCRRWGIIIVAEGAKDDLDVIDEIVYRDQLTNMVAFHSQQAVEKIYKSITEEFEVDFIKTHKLEILNEAVKKL